MVFLAENAWQEIEIFILAGQELPTEWRWSEIRSERNLKETYFADFVRTRATQQMPYEGRKRLMAEAIRNWNRIKARCPEDIGALLQRLQVGLSAPM